MAEALYIILSIFVIETEHREWSTRLPAKNCEGLLGVGHVDVSHSRTEAESSKKCSRQMLPVMQ